MISDSSGPSEPTKIWGKVVSLGNVAVACIAAVATVTPRGLDTSIAEPICDLISVPVVKVAPKRLSNSLLEQGYRMPA